MNHAWIGRISAARQLPEMDGPRRYPDDTLLDAIDAGKYIALEWLKNGAKTQYGLAPDRFIASASGVLRRRSPGALRIVGGAVLFFGRRAIRTSPVPPGGMEKRQLPLSQWTRPSPPGG
jgi:hypothetical protein